jgi:Family of unknown function (DUF6258)
MNIIEFLKTIYLGDRGCKAILVDGWKAEVKVQVTCISRVRSATWNHYTAEDITDGFLVFQNVRSVSFEPSGVIPNDLINDIQAEEITDGQAKYLVTLSVDGVSDVGDHTEVKIRIEADSMALEKFNEEGKRITE